MRNYQSAGLYYLARDAARLFVFVITHPPLYALALALVLAYARPPSFGPVRPKALLAVSAAGPVTHGAGGTTLTLRIVCRDTSRFRYIDEFGRIRSADETDYPPDSVRIGTVAINAETGSSAAPVANEVAAELMDEAAPVTGLLPSARPLVLGGEVDVELPEDVRPGDTVWVHVCCAYTSETRPGDGLYCEVAIPVDPELVRPGVSLAPTRTYRGDFRGSVVRVRRTND